MPKPVSRTKDNAGYISFSNSNKEEVIKNYSRSVDSFDVVTHGSTYNYGPFDNVVTDVNVRVPFDRRDYEYFRPNEATPRRFRDIIASCRRAYTEIGIVRNVIDMMTDFACEDMRIQHPDKKIEGFFKVWMKKTKLNEVVQEFVRHFLVDGNVVVKRVTARLPKPIENEWNSKTVASPDLDRQIKEDDNVEKREIPWRYMFINVASLEWVGGNAAKMADQRSLSFRLSPDIVSIIKSTDPKYKNIVDNLPGDIKDQVSKGANAISLDMTKIHVSHNKKDSWEDWAPPFLISILKDIRFKEKLRMAETAALDGIINVIRLWKLGDHKEGVLPDDGAVNKLVNILDSNVGGGTMDIVWDSMIDMKEYYPPVENILGAEKYTQVNKDILIGLGVPEVLIGGEGANFSNSWIQLKTLIERLNYIRGKLKEWISKEVEMVCDSLGIASYPRVKFNEMNLEDESTNRKLIIGLLDRGIVSIEAVLEAYGQDFVTELNRMRNEKKSGLVAKSPLDKPEPTAPGGGKKSPTKKPSPNNNGRPPASKDSSTRTTRTPKIRTKAVLFALDAIDAIDEYIVPAYMESFGVDNARKLTTEQKEKINIARSTVLSCVKLGDDITEDGIFTIAENMSSPNLTIIKAIEQAISDFASEHGHAPTVQQRKRIEAIAWSNIVDTENEVSH